MNRAGHKSATACEIRNGRLTLSHMHGHDPCCVSNSQTCGLYLKPLYVFSQGLQVGHVVGRLCSSLLNIMTEPTQQRNACEQMLLECRPRMRVPS